MSRRPYLSQGLARGDQPGTWVLPLTEDECSGAGRLFGGTGLGAAVRVLEPENRTGTKTRKESPHPYRRPLYTLTASDGEASDSSSEDRTGANGRVSESPAALGQRACLFS